MESGEGNGRSFWGSAASPLALNISALRHQELNFNKRVKKILKNLDFSQQNPPIFQLQNQEKYGEKIEEYAARSRKREGMKGSTGGEIVQVQGGHIVRATGRKDRHSKVYTAKGPRDRRVRLSAHTAIQFYDVQDRLGYDRPSKAVDWLIKKAKTAIDKLAELPPWHPFDTNMEEANQNAAAAAAAGSTAEMVIAEQSESSGYSSFIAPSLDPDAIPDTMKSLFPISSSTASSMNFQSYASRTGNANQDLGLSLHPFHQDQDFSMNWISNSNNNNNNNTSADDRGGLINRGFNLHLPPPLPLLSQDTDFSQHHQRGTLQSSFANSFRVWNDLAMANSSADHHSHRTQDVHRQWFAPEGLSSFGIPARIHGEEEQSVVSDRPSSSSTHSQH